MFAAHVDVPPNQLARTLQEDFYGREIFLADREMVEQNSGSKIHTFTFQRVHFLEKFDSDFSFFCVLSVHVPAL